VLKLVPTGDTADGEEGHIMMDTAMAATIGTLTVTPMVTIVMELIGTMTDTTQGMEDTITITTGTTMEETITTVIMVDTLAMTGITAYMEGIIKYLNYVWIVLLDS